MILTVLTCVIRLADHVNITPPLLPFIPIIMDIGVRANIHWGGGQTDFCPNGFRRWGGGGSSRNFPGSIICGGKVVGDIFRGPCAPDSVGGGNGSIFSVNCSNIPYIRVIQPCIVFCPNNVDSVRIILSTNCPNWGGATAPRPVRLCLWANKQYDYDYRPTNCG